ncbi:MAG TPA: siderophore ABC transporter substrate-binding protein [Candidatus Paenibacillus intestinavium]|nr:siderophore ABC transporter substrate-binding protein [Candidatus Paenibacillus intestinavium]
MKKSLSMMMLVLVMAIVMAACGNNATNNGATGGATNTPTATPENSTDPAATSVKVTHLLGETNAPINPGKVVVFDFGVLDTLDRLGVESIVAVPQDSLPAYLEKYASSDYMNAGGLKEPDFEAIDGADPDLIIISGRQSEAYEELTKIAPTIYMGVDNADYLNSFTSNVETLATIFGKEEQAATELAAINEVIANVKANVSTTDKKGLIILANEGKISAYGPGSRFGLIHDVLGVPAVDDTLDISTHGNEITFEYIAEKNPGYLFVIDRTAAVGGEGNAKDTVENDLVKNTDAFKDGKITYLDPQYWYLSGGGLISVEKMVKDIDAAVK